MMNEKEAIELIEKERALAVKEASEVAVSTKPSDWECEEFDVADVVFPALSCQQSNSKFFKKGKTKIGDIVDTSTAKVFGSTTKSFDFIPFHCYKELHTMLGSKMIGRERLNAENKNLPKEEVTKDGTVKRFVAMIFFGIVPGAGPLPYALSFRSTSFFSGKQMYTQMYVTNKLDKKLPCSLHMLIWSEEAPPKDGNTWNVMKVAVAQNGDGTPKESMESEIEQCWQWLRTMRGKNLKIMDEESESAE
jgi:hypothetical protein